MKMLLRTAIVALVVGAAPLAHAAQRTVTLSVKNMSCVTCGPIVQKSLSRVPGVLRVKVAQTAGAATVVYDDTKADIAALTAATTKAGFPSQIAGKARR